MNVVFRGVGWTSLQRLRGLVFFGRNGCFVGVDVYFTVFFAFDVALKTEIDQRQKSSKNVINSPTLT